MGLGAMLEEHSKRKHKILREYFFAVSRGSLQTSPAERFRLAVVDGFAGGGRYRCGTAGSPVIFIEELKRAIEAVNSPPANGLGAVEIECLLILNDDTAEAVEALKAHVAPLMIENARTTHGSSSAQYLTGVRGRLSENQGHARDGRYRNVLFNLDQCGHRHVERSTLVDIMRAYPSVEIFYTFAIESLLAFLQKHDPVLVARQLQPFGIDPGG